MLAIINIVIVIVTHSHVGMEWMEWSVRDQGSHALLAFGDLGRDL